MGGLGGAVAEHLAERASTPDAPTPRLLRLGMPDAYLEADSQQALLERAGLSTEAIARAVAERL